LETQYLAPKKGIAGSSGTTYQAWPGS
jgi:hypothetical protein